MSRFYTTRSLAIIGLTGLLVACGGGSGSGDSDDSDDSDSDASSARLPSLINASHMVDVDADGDLDIVLGWQGEPDLTADIMLINNGDGDFSILQGAFPDHHLGSGGATVNITSADFNNDGSIDIIASTSDARDGTFDDTIQIHLYLGNGDGTFTDATSNITGGLVTEYIEWIRVADFDGDGNTDFLITSNGCAESMSNNYGNCHGGSIFLNDGSTNFSIATVDSTDAEMTYSNTKLVWDSDANTQAVNVGGSRVALDVFAGDLNGDNLIDLVAPNGYAGGPIATFINNSTPGKLSFSIVYSFDVADVYQTNRVKNGALLDIDGDGDLDMVASGSISGSDSFTTPVIAYVNDGAGLFTEDSTRFATEPGVEHARQWLVSDFNGDGRDDLIVADHGFDFSPFPGQKNLLLINDGAGVLVDKTADNLSTLSGFTHGVSAGDVNGDGSVDLFLNNAAIEPNASFAAEMEARFWLNDGSGVFTGGDLSLAP
jgi:hypothetical protein